MNVLVVIVCELVGEQSFSFFHLIKMSRIEKLTRNRRKRRKPLRPKELTTKKSTCQVIIVHVTAFNSLCLFILNNTLSTASSYITGIYRNTRYRL